MTNTLNKIIHNGDEYELPRQKALVVTLTSAGWSNNEQTVTATGVTANNSVIASPVPASISDYADAGIYCSAQGIDSLTFTCSTTPSNDIEVNVIVLSAEVGSTPTPPTPPTPWQPGVNTIAYYKLDGNANDYLGNYNGTWSGTSAYKTLSSGIQVAYMPQSNALSYIYSSCQTLPKTVSFWFQKENRYDDGSGAKDWLQLIGQCDSESGNWQLRFNAHNLSQYNHFKLSNSSGENNIGGLVPNFGNTNWHNIVLTLTNGDNKLYYDGSLFGTLGGNCTVGGNLYMGGNPFGQNGTYERQLAGCMSEVILEDKVRTAQEVADYFNQTKALYGIS